MRMSLDFLTLQVRDNNKMKPVLFYEVMLISCLDQVASQTVTLAPSASPTTVVVKLNAVKWKAVDSSKSLNSSALNTCA